MTDDDRTRFDRAIAAIDAANAEDPTRMVVRGVERPKELVHAELATGWVERLRPDAAEALLLAIRGHHIRRWTSRRDAYPEGRSGYLRWRADLQRMHAATLGTILEEAGYDDATVTRVQEIVRKRDLAHDPEVQAFEDALCLVFVETQFHDLAGRIDRDTMVDAVRKTLAKMSPQATQLALSLVTDEGDRRLLEAAL